MAHNPYLDPVNTTLSSKLLLNPRRNHRWVMELLNKSQWKVPIIAFLACFGVSISMAFTSVAISRGFGARDLLPFLTWTLAFAVIVSPAAQMLVYTFVKVSPLPRFLLAGASGIVTGVLWTYAVAQLLGPWVGAFSLPVLFCWIAGGTSGMISALLYHESRGRTAMIAIPVILVSTLSALTLSKSLGVLPAGKPQVELLVIKWDPGPEPLTSTEVLGLTISKSDLEHLKAIGLTGEVMYSGSANYKEGQPGRVIIVTQAPLSEPVNLPQPDGSDVIIYVQGESGWNRFPREAATSQRQIRLRNDRRGSSRSTLFSVERPDGSREGGTAATW
jgi:hypothetical protein